MALMLTFELVRGSETKLMDLWPFDWLDLFYRFGRSSLLPEMGFESVFDRKSNSFEVAKVFWELFAFERDCFFGFGCRNTALLLRLALFPTSFGIFRSLLKTAIQMGKEKLFLLSWEVSAKMEMIFLVSLPTPCVSSTTWKLLAMSTSMRQKPSYAGK